MTTQGEGLTGLDPVKAAVWITIIAALAKGFHIFWKWTARRVVIPLFSETAREVLAEDLKTLHDTLDLSRETAAQLGLTVLELERAIATMARVSASIDELVATTEDHRVVLQAIATYLDHELPPLPDRRVRKGGRSE